MIRGHFKREGTAWGGWANKKMRAARATDGINVRRETAGGDTRQHGFALRTTLIHLRCGYVNGFDALIREVERAHNVGGPVPGARRKVVKRVIQAVILVTALITCPHPA